MKYLSIAVVLVAITGTLVALRGLAWSESGAAGVRTAEYEASAEKRREPADGTTLFVAGGDVKDSSGSERLIARIAAENAAHLHDKAKRQPDNVRLWEQAAAHYRACLSHETTTDAGATFADARKSLEQIERQLTRLKSRQPAKVVETPAPKPAEKPAEKTPTVKKDDTPAPKPAPTPAPAQKAKEKEEPLTYGPDGTPIRREKAD